MKFVEAPEAASWFELPFSVGHVAALAVLCVIAGFLLWQARFLLPARRRKCRWKQDNVTRRSGLTRWQCMDCGVDAFARDGKAPKECKRALRDAGL